MNGLEAFERIDNTLCLNNIKGKLEFGIDTEEHTDCDSAIGMSEDLEAIKQALLKAQEPKKYLKWEDIDFSYGTKVQKVRMNDTIYKIVYANYDNTKEVQLLSEDEKLLYFNFVGKYKDNVQLFNDLHLERVEE